MVYNAMSNPTERSGAAVQRPMPSKEAIDSARSLLASAGMFYGSLDDDDEEDKQTLNMNDTWCCASAFGEYVPNADLPEVARLFVKYGYCGVLYWVSEKNDQMRSEFHDINRFIEFVRHEERICAEVPGSSKRAYHKACYLIGGT